MKRWIAWLMAIILAVAPAAATAADAQRTELSFQASAEGVTDLLMMLGMSAADADNSAALAAAMLEALTVESITQDDGFRAAVLLGGNEILMFSAQEGEDHALILRSDMLPGLALTADADQLAASFADDMTQMMSAADTDLVPILAGWVEQCGVTVEQGAFVGDAYTGGTSRMTICFDGEQLAALLDTLAEKLSIGAQTRSDLKLAGQADVNRYRVSLVSDDERPIGLSLTVLDRQDDQLATLSVGWDAAMQDVKAVLGYGRDGHVFYDVWDVRTAQDDRSAEMAVGYLLFNDDDLLGYPAASQMQENLLAQGTLEIGLYPNTGVWLLLGCWQAAFMGTMALTCTSDGTDVTGLLEAGFLTSEVNEAVRMNVKQTNTEPVELAVPGEKTVQFDPDNDAAQGDALDILEALRQGQTDLVIRLIRNLPEEVLQVLMTSF